MYNWKSSICDKVRFKNKNNFEFTSDRSGVSQNCIQYFQKIMIASKNDEKKIISEVVVEYYCY